MQRASWLKLLILGGMLLLGGLMRADLHHATLFGVPGPPCLLGSWLDEAACPGCGLVRSTVLCLHGHWRESLAIHPAGILIVLLCIAGFVVHLDVLIRGRLRVSHLACVAFSQRLFVAALLGAWMVRLIV